MSSTQISIQETAEKLSLTPQQVRSLCRENKLYAKKVGKTWIIDEQEVEYYKAHNTCGETNDKIRNTISYDYEKAPIALSFFTGAMGLDLGIEKAGFKTLLACETDNACRKTIAKNKPDIALIGDIRNYSADNIRENAGLTKKSDIDLVIGGPPCQAFSTAGKRKGFEDERGNVFLTFIERIIELRPKYAVIENVRGILSAPLHHTPHAERKDGKISYNEMKGGALIHILSLLKASGYGVSFNLYNAANFGVPQKRERIIIIASRDGEELPYLTPTHSENSEYFLPKWRTFREATVGLEGTTHTHLNFPEKRLKYYKLLKPGQYWKDLPNELQKEALGKSYYSGGGKTGFLRRLDWDVPSPTLVTHPAMPATDLAHPEENRPLSIQEYKRLQQFPDNWDIEGSLIEQYRQIGNAVPIGLGEAVGNLLINYINGRHINMVSDFKYSRYNNTNEKTWYKEINKIQGQLKKKYEVV